MENTTKRTDGSPTPEELAAAVEALRNAAQSVLVLRPTAVLPQSRLRRPPVLLKANSRMQFSRSKTAVTAAILRATRQICPAQWA